MNVMYLLVLLVFVLAIIWRGYKAEPIMHHLRKYLDAANSGANYVTGNDKTLDESGFTVPGYHYIGPGNKVYDDQKPDGPDNDPKWNLPPRDALDELARLHDLAYSRALTIEDADEADAKLISEANKLPDSFVKSIIVKGITTKSWFESHFGHQYPANLLTRKQLAGK